MHDKKRKQPPLPTHNYPGKYPHMELNDTDDLEENTKKKDWQANTLSAMERRSREVPEQADLELLKQKKKKLRISADRSAHLRLPPNQSCSLKNDKEGEAWETLIRSHVSSLRFS
jgi:hypothetical protein